MTIDFYFVKTPMLRTFFIPAYGDTGDTYIFCVGWLRCEITKDYWRYF